MAIGGGQSYSDHHIRQIGGPDLSELGVFVGRRCTYEAGVDRLGRPCVTRDTPLPLGPAPFAACLATPEWARHRNNGREPAAQPSPGPSGDRSCPE